MALVTKREFGLIVLAILVSQFLGKIEWKAPLVSALSFTAVNLNILNDQKQAMKTIELKISAFENGVASFVESARQFIEDLLTGSFQTIAGIFWS